LIDPGQKSPIDCMEALKPLRGEAARADEASTARRPSLRAGVGVLLSGAPSDGRNLQTGSRAIAAPPALIVQAHRKPTH